MVSVTDRGLVALLILIGAVLFAAGVAGGYVSSLSSPEFFIAWMFLAFIGIIVALVGIAMGGKPAER
jgi:uncharacterized membrane protein YgaE (UPF0421/DUF939 family)